MQVFGLVGLLITIAIAAWWFTSMGPVAAPQGDTASVETNLDPTIQAEINTHENLILLTSPEPNEVITSPLTLTGKARGNWYFEGSFPVVLTDWDGRILAEGFAQARGPWMTEDFVPFTLTLHFESPYHSGDSTFMSRGSLILRKDNPSGMPENDDALEIPIMFKALDDNTKANANSSYHDAIDQARKAANSLEF